MSKSLAEAREQLVRGNENPFKEALSRLATIAGGNGITKSEASDEDDEEEEDVTTLSASIDLDDDEDEEDDDELVELLLSEDDSEDELFDSSSDDDDDDDEEEDEDEDEDDELFDSLDEDDDDDEEDEDEDDDGVTKSLGDYGIPAAQEQFVEMVLASPYAKHIDASAALRETVNMFGAELARERAVFGEVVKSYDALGQMAEDVAFLKNGLQILATALQKSLEQQSLLMAQNEAMAKSLTSVGQDVALVKSQPAVGGMVPLGSMGTPPLRHEAVVSGITISKHDLHKALGAAVNAGEMNTQEAANAMAAIDSPRFGVEGVYNSLPELVKARVHAR